MNGIADLDFTSLQAQRGFKIKDNSLAWAIIPAESMVYYEISDHIKFGQIHVVKTEDDVYTIKMIYPCFCTHRKDTQSYAHLVWTDSTTGQIRMECADMAHSVVGYIHAVVYPTGLQIYLVNPITHPVSNLSGIPHAGVFKNMTDQLLKSRGGGVNCCCCTS